MEAQRYFLMFQVSLLLDSYICKLYCGLISRGGGEGGGIATPWDSRSQNRLGGIGLIHISTQEYFSAFTHEWLHFCFQFWF